jgi:hypothetical protein
MTEPQPVECDDNPKLTEDEWAFIEATSGEGDN